jgi:hypothetical protein
VDKGNLRSRLLASTFIIVGIYYINKNVTCTDSFYKLNYYIYQEYYKAQDYFNNKLVLKEDSSIEKNKKLEISEQYYESATALINDEKYDEAIVKLIHVISEDTKRYQDAQMKIDILENIQLANKHYYNNDKINVVKYVRAVLALDPKNTDILSLRKASGIIDIMGYPLKYPNELANKAWHAEFETYSYFKRTITFHEDGTLELLYTSAPVASTVLPVTLTFKGTYKLTDEDGINGTWTANRLNDPSIKYDGNFSLITGPTDKLSELCIWDQNTFDIFTGYYS